MIQATLSNPKRADMPSVQVCFPISGYKEIYTKLEAIGIGSVLERDCCVTEISGSYPILKRLESTAVNVDEMDYLAKRLESFDKHELAKFQGVAVANGYSDMTDLINLTFCCQEATVVRDFSDLGAIGRQRYMDLHGGITEDELKKVDFQKTALSLLLNESGQVTPYGVIYDNCMCMEQIYKGKAFPAYDYSGESIIMVEIANRNEPETSESSAWLLFPVEDCCVERAMLRGGINTVEDLRWKVISSELPPDLDLLHFAETEQLQDLNVLSAEYQMLDDVGRKKYGAVIRMASASNLTEAINLIKQLDLFDFVPGISTAEEYGRYMIMKSGHFNYDGELDEFYDFKKYGNWRINNEHGLFTPDGYISYHGFISIEEVMAGSETERMGMTMGGM
ncbi:MAG: YfcZ/YiiS family protein [Bacillota bacterium]